MLKTQAIISGKIALAADLLVTAFSFILAYYIRHDLLSRWLGSLYPLDRYIWALLIILPLWWILFKAQDIYQPHRILPFKETLKMILKTVLLGTLVIMTILYIFRLHYFSRPLVLFFGLVNVLLLILKQITVRYVLSLIRESGYNLQEILIVGTGQSTRKLIQAINGHKEWGFRIAGLVGQDPQLIGKEVEGIKVIGLLKNLPKLIKEKVIDEVIFAVPREWLSDLDDAVYACEEMGINTRLTVDWFQPLIAKSRLDEVDKIPSLVFSATPDYGWSLLAKNVLDIVASFLLLIILSPLFLLIGLFIKLTSKGPVFFVQTRLGLNGRRFRFYKFRSMIVDAETKLKPLLKDNDMNGPVFKMKNDPRITKIGFLLRKSSLDELPQLYNVLKGEMSLVGPRPPLPEEVKKYGRWQRRRLSVKPGITGLWQVSGRGEIKDFNEWLRLDLEYIDNWSLWLDFKILLKTFWVVLTAKGAS